MIVDQKLAQQLIRCRASLVTIDVPEEVLEKFDRLPASFLMQLAHLAVFKEVPWRDAVRWVLDHRWEIMAYENGEIDEWGKKRVKDSAATNGSDREVNGADVGTARKG